jgi:lipopolysaccharide heptosyltransferase I
LATTSSTPPATSLPASRDRNERTEGQEGLEGLEGQEGFHQLMNRVLIVRLGSLGDIVHAIPVAAALRRAYPAARIDWLVSARYREILDLVPILDRRLVIDGRGSDRAKDRRQDASNAAAPRYMTLPGAMRELRRSRYDVAIDLQGLLKSAVLARGSGAKRVIGFASSYLRERLARPFYTDVYDPGCGDIYDPRETRHVVQINLGLLEPLGVSAGVPAFPIAPVESDVAHAMGERTNARYVLLNPGAAWPNKRWPASRFGRVAAALRERHGLLSIALWGEGERALADEVADHASGAAIVSPPSSIADLVALSRAAALIVSGDTGPAHIAAAVGTPVVGIFGPTRPMRNGPWLPDDVTVSRVDICQCHHLRRCQRETMCLTDISVEEVVDAVERRLAAGSSRLENHPLTINQQRR